MNVLHLQEMLLSKLSKVTHLNGLTIAKNRLLTLEGNISNKNNPFTKTITSSARVCCSQLAVLLTIFLESLVWKINKESMKKISSIKTTYSIKFYKPKQRHTMKEWRKSNKKKKFSRLLMKNQWDRFKQELSLKLRLDKICNNSMLMTVNLNNLEITRGIRKAWTKGIL